MASVLRVFYLSFCFGALLWSNVATGQEIKKMCLNGMIVSTTESCPPPPLPKPKPSVESVQSTVPETRIGEEGFTSPPAKIADVAWLLGAWAGDGIGGAKAYENWLPPSGGTMVGSFVQEKPDGTILFTEHMYLMEENESLVVRLKHFGPDLKAWEEKDEMVSFRLLSVEPCAAYFNALTYRCIDPEDPSKGLVVAVRMKSGKELDFRFYPFGTVD